MITGSFRILLKSGTFSVFAIYAPAALLTPVVQLQGQDAALAYLCGERQVHGILNHRCHDAVRWCLGLV